jgi:hypothetical protein
MPQIETMTQDEKLAISNRAFDLLDTGDKEGFRRLIRTAPIPPYLAKVAKEKNSSSLFNKCQLSS